LADVKLSNHHFEDFTGGTVLYSTVQYSTVQYRTGGTERSRKVNYKFIILTTLILRIPAKTFFFKIFGLLDH
jgi:hypothetical protein